MDITDIVLGRTAETGTKKRTSDYEIVAKDNCDLVIRRKNAKASKLLVLLVSQSQFYLKDERNGNVSALTVSNLRGFTSGIADGLYIGNDFWLDTVYQGTDWADAFVIEISDPDKVKAIKEHRHVFNGQFDFAPKDTISVWFSKQIAERFNIPLAEAVWIGERFAGRQYGRVPDRKLGFNGKVDYRIASLFGKQFGLDNARKILNAYLDTDINFMPEMYSVLKVFGNKIVFDADKFISYFIYQLIEEGFEGRTNCFWENVGDVYQMQRDLYGKIKDKYPKNLLTYHDKLAYICRLHKQEIDERKWKSAAEAEKRFEYKGTEYSIIAPKTPDDMYDEARQQCNCLASYVNSVLNRRCMIFFMRKNSDPGSSLVTIEVRPDMTLGQVKAHNNAKPKEEYMDFVQEWSDKKLKPAMTA